MRILLAVPVGVAGTGSPPGRAPSRGRLPSVADGTVKHEFGADYRREHDPAGHRDGCELHPIGKTLQAISLRRRLIGGSSRYYPVIVRVIICPRPTRPAPPDFRRDPGGIS